MKATDSTALSMKETKVTDDMKIDKLSVIETDLKELNASLQNELMEKLKSIN